MKLVVGLGNPQARYAATRHNIGARIALRFAADCGIELNADRFSGRFGSGPLAPDDGAGSGAVDVGILTPETYMNRSGGAVAAALHGLSLEDVARDLLIVVDDLDLPFGRLRIRPRGGSAGHRGLDDVIEHLGHGDFPRLRFGIGRPETDIAASDWVLQPFTTAEEAQLERHIPWAAEAVGSILRSGVVIAMNRYNRDAEPAD